jgi:hypothetical protein
VSRRRGRQEGGGRDVAHGRRACGPVHRGAGRRHARRAAGVPAAHRRAPGRGSAATAATRSAGSSRS